MKASELRIGNWIEVKCIAEECGGDDFDPQQCNLQNIISISEGTEDFLFRPIPLTEEWLIKCKGWTKEEDLYIRKLDVINDALRLDYINGDGELCWEYYVYNISGQRVGCAYIKYVHELQNLYFALNGEELEINN